MLVESTPRALATCLASVSIVEGYSTELVFTVFPATSPAVPTVAPRLRSHSAAAAASPSRPLRPTTSISRPARSGAAVVVVEDAEEDVSDSPRSVACWKRLTASLSFSGVTTT